MGEKTKSREELLKAVREALEKSPTLGQNQAQKATFLEVYEDLEMDDLHRLYELLQQESVDWQAWISEADGKRQEILEKGQQEAAGFVKKAQKTAEKQISSAESQAAEKLLKDY